MHIPVRPVFTAALALLATAACALAGPLDPPAGPITPTQKPLAEIEPRTPISLSTTPGDANSLFRISQPGSYYLTANITGVAAKHGIEIAVAGVTVDLNGFSLIGVPGSLDGVSTGALADTVEVRNGIVRSWGGTGVNLDATGASSSSVRNVRSTINGGAGILVPQASVVVNCTALGNGTDGISVRNACTVIACTAESNDGVGIAALSACTITGCTAYDNITHGISAGFGGVVTGSTAHSNLLAGISGASGVTISNNTCRANGTDGILVVAACTVIANTCSSNGQAAATGAGVHATGADNRLEANNCCVQDRGIDVDVAGSIIVRNTCSGNTTNWAIVAGNVCLVVSAATGGAISGNSGGVAPGSTDPSANFTY